MEEFLRLVALGRLNVDEMTTHTFPIGQATDAYKLILENPAHESFLGVLLEYPTSGPVERRLELDAPAVLRGTNSGVVKVGLIGGGMFARGTILPALKGAAPGACQGGCHGHREDCPGPGREVRL